MSYVQINHLSADPDSVSVPAQIDLNYNIDGDVNTPIDLYYQLNTGNNVYFVLPNGGLTKEIIKTIKLASKTTAVSQTLKLTKSQDNEESEYCFIYVQAVNKLNNMSDIKHCTINFL